MGLSATIIILILTVVVSLYAWNNDSLQRRLMYSPYRLKYHNEWYRAVTHAFIHKDGFHLFFNMFVLYQFGYSETAYGPIGVEATLIEDFGTKGIYLYVLLYIGGFLFATIPSLFKHGDNQGYWSLGASGAVSAVVFGFILLMPDANLGLIFIPIPIPAPIFGILYLAYEIYMDKKGGTYVAHDAHIWGALFGIVFLIILKFDYLKDFIEGLKNIF